MNSPRGGIAALVALVLSLAAVPVAASDETTDGPVGCLNLVLNMVADSIGASIKVGGETLGVTFSTKPPSDGVAAGIVIVPSLCGSSASDLVEEAIDITEHSGSQVRPPALP